MREEDVFLDEAVTLTRRQILVAETLMTMALLDSGVCDDFEKLTDEIAWMNQLIYHPDTIPKEFMDYAEVSKEEE